MFDEAIGRLTTLRAIVRLELKFLFEWNALAYFAEAKRLYDIEGTSLKKELNSGRIQSSLFIYLELEIVRLFIGVIYSFV